MGEDAAQDPEEIDEEASDYLMVDVRRFSSSLVRPLLTALLDDMIELKATDALYVVCDYEPSALAHQFDLRHETRGRLHTECRQRFDGTWVLMVKQM